MNKRIKELAITSGLSEFISETEKVELGNELVKFAELIIEECAGQCFTDDYINICKHFGMPIPDDEELEDGCPCGHDGGTSCGAVNCQMITTGH